MASFDPPTSSQSWTDEPLFRYFKAPRAVSLVLRNGAWVETQGLDHEEISELEEGVSYFEGGRHYANVDTVTAASLVAAGYSVGA